MTTRRDFLKIGAATTILALAPVSALIKYLFAPPEAEFNGRVFRGTANGEILTSNDQKQTWQKQINLGSDYRVAGLHVNGNNTLQAKIDFQGHDFDLTLSEDEQNWLVI